MERIRRNSKSLPPLFLFLFLCSCIGDLKEVKEVDWNISPEFALPVAKATLSLAEAFKPEQDSSLFIYPDEHGILHLYVKQELTALDLSELLLDSFESAAQLDESFILPKPPGGFSIESPVTYFRMLFDSMNFDHQIDTLLLNDGNIEFDLRTWEHYDAELSINLPDLTDANGKTLGFSGFRPSVSNHKVAFSLKNCKLKINTTPTSKGVFTIILGYKITTRSSGDNVSAPEIAVKLSGLDIHAAYGKIGSLTRVFGPMEKSLNSYDLIENDEVFLDLDDPQINIIILNQIGVPFLIDSIEFNLYRKDSVMKVTGIQESVYIDSPPFGEERSYSENKLKIEPWSNIDLLFSKLPEKFEVGGKVILDPYQTGSYNFMTEDDTLALHVEADIPLRFSLNQVRITNTSQADLSFLNNVDKNIDLLKLQVKVKNHFPLEMRMQAYFTDSNARTLDSLFTAPAQIKGALTPAIPSESVIWVDKNNAQISKLKNATQINVRATFFTSGNDSAIVDFNHSQSLELEIIGYTRVKL
ncbi:MAG: hypothetical protein WBK43_08375 [Prolixibacteraceae bacterium]|jgi:hypothetical protein|nr:hypothetical protein [Prolixibacteraceae bacterium]MDI9564095.1 hypothetical protein [Bacteroidota bacterium]NLT00357.1 hypothetical protein [Bacteroidales bacterium]OQB79843.1 MAG: hypothetical protein BWX87_01841 [Bacteroidetes bacterium ADurb.Bin123]HNZ69991.1 hypothetical protein [Prolixibacteraceae bacterium]